MVDAVTGFVLEKLGNLLIDEASLFSGAEDEVKSLKQNLGFMKAFLKDSDGKEANHHMVKELVDQIREAAFDAEDVINAYMAHVIKHQMRNLLQRSFHYLGHVAALQNLAKKTKSLSRRVRDIYDNQTTYGIEVQSHVDEEAEQSLKKRRRNVEEEDVVGFVDDTEKLIHQLLDRDRLQREVISIIGMGGLGKTTLARKIYNNTNIKNRFHHCVWVNVSEEYNTIMLIIDILKCVGRISDETYKMSDEQLKGELRKNLEGKRYFVVMDDVWKPQFWDEIRACFPNDSNGSRILITSREKEVASNASSTPPYFLPFLDEEASWQLLCKKAFRGEKCPSNLESLGRKLAESCKGLPLSIVVLGGILANKAKTHQAWSHFVGNVNWFLIDDDKKRCADILALSYNHLPRKLRMCFLYVGVFPEDFLIPARMLIQMWVAEGFISVQNDSRKMDEIKIAEQYLERLIDRSLIQVESRRSDGGVKRCRIHDLLRDFCIKMSIQQKFYEVRVNELSSSNTNPRRLSIQGKIDSSESISFSAVGSLFSFTPCFVRNPLEWASEAFRFSRLLTFQNLRPSCDGTCLSIPEEIGGLVFLRYFSVSNVDLESIPASICKLPYLETIYVEGSIAKCLPNEIWMMRQLRHLQVKVGPGDDGIKLPQPPSRGGHTLCKLQVLSCVDLDVETAILFRKSLFPNLRNLDIVKRSERNKDENIQVSTAMLASLETLQCLEILKFWAFDFRRLSNSFPSSSKLTMITFEECNFLNLNSLMGSLGKLANLRILKIKASYQLYPQLHFRAGDFPQLEVFKMILIHGFEGWELETHALPNLQHLVINNCVDLKNLPDELCNLANLRMVEVSGNTAECLKKKAQHDQAIKEREDGYSWKLIIN